MFTVLSHTLERLWCSQHALVALDARYHIIDGNAAFCGWLEHPRETILNQPLKAFCTPETSLGFSSESAPGLDTVFDKRHHPQAFTLLSRGGNHVPVHVVETWLIKSSGLLFYVWVLATADSEQATRAALETIFDEVIVEAETNRHQH